MNCNTTHYRANSSSVPGDPTGAGDVPVVAEFPQYAAHPATQALVGRYLAAAAPAAARKVGTLAGAATKQENEHGESLAGLLIADAQLAAGKRFGAQVAFINSGGIRAGIEPAADGGVTFGQIFAAQPFGNNLVVNDLSGSGLKQLLEQQFASGSNSAERPNMLLPSEGLSFTYDLRRAPGERITALAFAGKPIAPAATYRVVVNNFLASGGDNFSVLAEAALVADAGLDLDALEAWLGQGAALPQAGRIRNAAPAAPR